MALIEIKDLTFTYPTRASAALSGLSFSVQEGEFLTVIGASGSGKTTLLRLLKPALAPHGERSGSILLFGTEPQTLAPARQTADIGFVMQDPEQQIITDKVWHELAFGLESLGTEPAVIRRRVAEMAAFFGIEDWFSKDVSELSGGQKQLLNLASVMVMQPKLLLLDEPTAQLDPIASTEFFNALRRIHTELGTTILLSEHRLEDAFALSDRVLVLENGKLLSLEAPAKTTSFLRESKNRLYRSMPTSARLCGALTVPEARAWLDTRLQTQPALPIPPRAAHPEAETAIELKNVCFRYEKNGKDVLKNASCRFAKGEMTAILGGNGCGKSTTLALLAGLRKPQSGKIRNPEGLRCGLLPQDPRTLFVRETVRQELEDALSGKKTEASETRLREIEILCKLAELSDLHPYDLSGGEMQRLALAKLLLAAPEVLLLDEPTKGMDSRSKSELAELLQTILLQGRTVILVSHDMEFCAAYADRCLFMFDGGFAAQGSAAEFFSGNCFYTTAASRIARGRIEGAVTCEELLTACGVQEPDFSADDEEGSSVPSVQSAPSLIKPLPLWRVLCAAVLFAVCAMLLLQIASPWKLPFLTHLPKQVLYGALAGSLVLMLLSVSRKNSSLQERKRLPRSFRLTLPILLLTVPATILAGVFLFDGKHYLLISLLVLAQIMVPFFLAFEKRRPSAREIVLIAVLSALTVAGRTVFYAVPHVKPVLALVIVSGVALGAEGGFLVGALSMLLSNLIFGQGPWTPWQMFAMGVCGFLAGVLYRRGILRRNRISLSVFGAVCAVLLYGVIMNVSSAVTWYSALSWETLLAYCISGFPIDAVHGASTFLFLFLFGEALLKKTDRIRVKYGLLQ